MPKMRIQYNSINVDIDRDFNAYLDKKFVNNAVVQSSSGQEQTVNFFTQQKVRASMRLVTAQKKQELDEWFDFVKGGVSFKFWRDWNLGTYIGFEGKSLKTNDGDAGTFTRALTTDSSYYLDPSTGLMTVLNTVDLPRFPSGKYGGGVLIEGARTNINDRPSDFTGTSSWAPTNMTVATTTETNDPADGTNADKLTADAANGRITFTTSTAMADSSMGVWLKSPNGTVSCELVIEGTTSGALDLGISVTPTWTYFSHNNSIGGLVGNLLYRIRILTNTEIIYAWGCNFEAGADQLFSSQVIGAVSTSSITRSADKLLYTAVDKINQDKGTISFWFTPEWIFDKHGSVVLFHSGADTTNRHLAVVFDSTGNFSTTMYKLNGSTFESVTGSGSTIVQNAAHHYVLTYDSTVSNGLINYLDGVLLATSSNSAFSASGIGTNFAVGSFNNGNNPSFCVIDDFEAWKDVKDASWVNERFNQNRGSGYGRNRFDNMLLDSYKTTERPNGFFDIELVMREKLS